VIEAAPSESAGGDVAAGALSCRRPRGFDDFIAQAPEWMQGWIVICEPLSSSVTLPSELDPMFPLNRLTGIFNRPSVRDVVFAIERALGKPTMRPLPAQSRNPSQTEAPKLESLEEVFNLGAALWQKRGSETISGREPVLILVHGIFDSVYGAAFSPLLLWGNLLGQLQQHYRGRIYGFDHETLSVDPLGNARDLLRLLAELDPRAPIDILCHSRGGLVTRALLQHPALKAARQGRTFRNVIFMGAANEGSPLAEPGQTGEGSVRSFL
jgi:hypothetical protein